MSAAASVRPAIKCKHLTFLPIPYFAGPSVAFGAPRGAFFERSDLPDVPRKFVDQAMSLFYNGGDLPKFQPDVDTVKARAATRAWLASFAPAHEAKEATVGYAFWVWSTPPDERLEAA